MSHARTQLREQVAALVTGLATTGARVYQSRMRPADGLPCLLVTTNEEDITPGSIGGLYQRRLVLQVRGFAKGSTTLDDTLDQIALEVETALAASRAELDRIEIDFDDELEQPVGSVTLTYQITYFTAASDPATLI